MLLATALLARFGNSFLFYTVSCLVEARDSISLHLEKEKSPFHFQEKLNLLHLLNFLFGEQYHHLSSCPSWTPSNHSSHSLYIQPPSPVDAPSLTTFQNGTSPLSHSKCLVSSLPVFHLAYHNSCLNGQTSFPYSPFHTPTLLARPCLHVACAHLPSLQPTFHSTADGV